jgi:1,4-alpha-glucan branching enzyme
LIATAAGEWPHHQPDALTFAEGAAAAEPADRRLAFVLHAHLPWVLGHGRWPHGEDWLAEAVAHCYLPLVGALRRLAARGGRHLLTVSVSPVLAAQLADPRTPPLVTDYLQHRRDAARALAAEHPLARWWETTYERLLAGWNELGTDLVGALGALAAADAIELSTCAATHGYLPLLHRREHVALQLHAARANHARWFGAPPAGLWMPECAYRPPGPWRHPATGAEEADRPGNETFLAAVGVRWTVVDAHLLLGGEPLAPYPELWGAGDEPGASAPAPIGRQLQPRTVGDGRVAVLPREPHTAHQVWSRHGGYPGDPRYLDFHKRHADSGLRLWRVTDAGGDLGGKLPYHPDAAMDAVRDQACHFPELLRDIAGLGGGVAVCPYDAELFGHWWFEGVAWLEQVLARCLDGGPITTTTPSRELAAHPPSARVALHEGSWGEEGDHRVWVNEQTSWMWEDLRRAEEAVDAALPALPPARARAALAQLLLLAASDWPFLVTTGTAADYASSRFRLHRDRLHELLAAADDGDAALPAWAAEDLTGLQLDADWWKEEVAPT